MVWLKYLALFPAIYAFVRATVELVEDLAGGKTGAEKKAIFMAAMEQGWASFQNTFGFKSAFNDFATLISLMVDVVVAVLNATGVFKKTNPTPVK